MILLVDNYDSFVYNLARYFEQLGQPTHVVRNDTLTVDEIRALGPTAIVLSPGPCTPNEAGISLEVVRQLYRETPILGVCLGHQTIAQALGGRVLRAAAPVHGRTSFIEHRGDGLFKDLPSPLQVCRYHSLIVDEATLPDELRVTARTSDGTIMALQHARYPLYGVQFHPEAILTQGGHTLLSNFLQLNGVARGSCAPEVFDELLDRGGAPFVPPPFPVTF